LVPMRSDERVESMLVICTDTTEQHLLQSQAVRSARLATLGVLAASVAHEINNPNNAMRFNASIFASIWRDVEPLLHRHREEHGPFCLAEIPFEEVLEDVPRLLEGMLGSSERIGTIVGNLKHLSRQDRGEARQAVDPVRMVQSALTILHGQIKRHTNHFRVLLPEEEEGPVPMVLGSAQQLEQVVINLVMNALQSLPERRCSVTLQVAFRTDRGVVEIRVEDRGRGIEPAHLSKLTDPFFTTRSGEGGTGLGLSITHTIVADHRGGVAFQVGAGQGNHRAGTVADPSGRGDRWRWHGGER
ncbi:MAG: hypothetical protein HQL50_15260, partial [Magnetococcales bacterium]|nr:hypothetical protein [Magnetococcales bacterium]